MNETNNLKLPLLQPAQAQKHVTVNEALVRLDGLTQLVLQSRTVDTPPVASTDGLVWFVPIGAVNAWDGQAGKLAIYDNGGWVFVSPQIGWHAWISDEGVSSQFDGGDWSVGRVSHSANGAGQSFAVAEVDHVIAAGGSSTTIDLIPAHSIVYGVTGRVIAEVTGGLTDWELGIPGAADRYGTGYGLSVGSWLRGLTGTPIAYYADTPLQLSASGGSFGGGTVRLAVHYATLALPSA